MIKKIKKQFFLIKKEWGTTFWLGLGILVVFFFFRLVNLTRLPVFADEAIYLRWAQVMKAESTLRFLPLSDGKQPLFMWLVIPFLKIFPNPLWAGRFLSVLTGLGSLLGLFLLTYLLFKDRKIALTTAFFYTLVPCFVFFDRMALVDSLLMMLVIWGFYLGILLALFFRLDLAMITGLVLGAGLITKSPALFLALLLPLAVLPAPWLNLKNKGKTLFSLIKLVGLWLVVYFFAFGVFNILRLGPNFEMIGIRNKDYVFSFSEFFAHPLDPLKPHLGDLGKWLPNLLTWPVLLLASGGLIWLFFKERKGREGLFLLGVGFWPLLVQSSLAKVFTPRYLLFTFWPFLILGAYFLVKGSRRLKIKGLKYFLVLFLFLLPALIYSGRLLFKVESAPLPRKMRSGYLEEWTAGQGIRESAEYLKKRAKNNQVLVGTEGYFGTLPDGLQVYLEGTPRVTVLGVGYPLNEIPESLTNSLVDNEVYLLVNQSRLLLSPEKNGLELIKAYPKAVPPGGKADALLFFRLRESL